MHAVPQPAPRSAPLARLEGERRLLADIAAGLPLPRVLDALLHDLCATLPAGLAAVLCPDSTGRLAPLAAVPALPPRLQAALAALDAAPDGEAPLPAPRALADEPGGAAAAAAAHAEGWPHGWSVPLRASDGCRLGRLVLCFDHPPAWAPTALETLAAAGQGAALAIEHHASARRLHEAEARHRQILDSAVDYAIIALDPEGRVTRWNEGAHRMLGWQEADMLGQTLHRCFTQKDIDHRRIEREMAAARAGRPSPDEGWRVRSDGSRIWASGVMTLLRGDDGEGLGFVKILRDRTQQRAADLRQAFLFELSERLHDVEGPAEVTDAVAERLGALLDVNRVGFGRVDAEARVHVERDWTDGSVPHAPGLYPLAEYGPGPLAALRAGQPLAVDDVAADPRTAPGAIRFAALDVAALLQVPLAPIPEGGEGGLVYVCASVPRRWTPEEVVLLREVGERLRLAAERARARQALRASEERLHIAQRAGSIGSFELFPGAGEVAVSASFCALWGLPEREKVDVADLIALVHPDDRPLLAIEPRPTPQRLAYVEYRIRRRDDGRLRWLARRGEVVADPRAGTVRYLGVCYDITDRRLATEALAASQQSLRLATEAAEIGTWDYDPAVGELTWTDRTRAMFGLRPGSAVTLALFEQGLHPEDRAPTLAAFAAALDPMRRETYDVEYRTIGLHDGLLRWVAAKGRGVFDETGHCVRAIGTAIDITARKQAQARQQLLLAIADRLRPSGRPLALLTDALQMLRGFLGVQRAGLARVDGDGLTIEAEQTDASAAADTGRHPLAAFERPLRERWRDGLATTVSLPTEAAPGAPGDTAGPPAFGRGAAVVVPLGGEGRLRALFYVAHPGPRPWPSDEVALIEDVAARVWDAVERARAEQALHEETRALETLNRTAALLAENFDLDTMVQHVIDAGVALSGGRWGAFFYTTGQGDGERLMLYALSGADRAAFQGLGMPRPTDVFAPTFRGEGVIRSDDITQDPRYGRNWPHAGLPNGHLAVRSYLAVPVVARSGEVLGCLLFGHPEPAVFTDRAERLACGLAAQAAIAIDNARLFQATQRDNETLEARVEERTRERDQVWALTEDLLAIADAQAQLQRVSASWTRQLGHPQARLVLQPFAAVLHPADTAPMAEALDRMRASGQPVHVENRVGTAEGDWRTIAWTLSPEPGTGRFVATGRDVTAERRRQAQLQEAQEALRQSQKMEAVGQLTGGIAHDFNNLLQGITGSLDLIRRRLRQGRTGELDRFIAGAMASAQRAAALTHRLLAFSRRQPLDPRPVAANPLVEAMADMLQRTLGETVTLELALAPDAWLTMCDANQLESAILNLAINARDAMPAGGRLTIRTANTRVETSTDTPPRDAAPGPYVAIEVADTGTGMTPDVLARAFEPFFTTKPIGQGTGLGLSMIYGFARQSGGQVAIDSTPGAGTTVRLLLPAYFGEPAGDEEPLSAAAEDTPSGHVVLVVEDEPVVRALVVDVLNELGYRALEAADGPAGLALLQSEQPIDLLVSDIGLPGLNGRQVADAARVLRPGLQVLFMTGYAETAAATHGFLEPGMQMITKPFSMEAMAARLREMLK